MVTKDHRNISIADQIFDQLEKDILTGKYPRGEVLNESHLSMELGVSRTPIHEALRRLEQENIVQGTSRGLVVVGIAREDMPDMYEIRIHIESLAAGRAAGNITDAELSEMREILAMQRFYIERQDESGIDNSDAIKDLDSRFHELLYQASGSKAFCDMLTPLHKRMTKFRKASVRKNSRAHASLAEHTAIFEALEAHDAAKAEEYTKRHLVNARDSIMTIEEE